MPENVLVTGGAGFIGRTVVEELLSRGHRVRVLDSLVAQVHGDGAQRPAALNAESEFIHGDLRDSAVVATALAGIDSVVHLAAEVGVGQSMYEIERYTSGNDIGTAVLFEQLIARPVRRVVTASSMSIYGEGLYVDADGAFVEDATRDARTVAARGWEPLDAKGRPLRAVPTPEWKRPNLTSIYALGKYVQERTTLILGEPYGMESVCLRLFNVYGPGQSLSNPYTGVLAIFASRLLNGASPMVFEDGEQRRDFVHVTDVAQAFGDALDRDGIAGEVLNVGSGEHRSVRQVGDELAAAMGFPDAGFDILEKFRVGDIRHCFCDTAKTAERLGFRARVTFHEGIAELAEWVSRQAADDKVARATAELEQRGLIN